MNFIAQLFMFLIVSILIIFIWITSLKFHVSSCLYLNYLILTNIHYVDYPMNIWYNYSHYSTLTNSNKQFHKTHVSFNSIHSKYQQVFLEILRLIPFNNKHLCHIMYYFGRFTLNFKISKYFVWLLISFLNLYFRYC